MSLQPMRRQGMLVAAFALCAALASCVTAPNHVTFATVNAPPRAFARRDPASVDVFIGKPPTRPHVDVGLFEVYQGLDDGVRRSTEDMLRTLRFHAGLRGCDAVQVLGVELAGGRYYERRIVRGVCEMYTDVQAQEAASRAAPPPLPGEGTSCGPPDPNYGMVEPTACPDPLVCSSRVCASPYR